MTAGEHGKRWHESEKGEPSIYHTFLYDNVQELFARHQFFAVRGKNAILGGRVPDFWDSDVPAEVCVVNTISCTDEPETFILFMKDDGGMVAIHCQKQAARWCIPRAPLLDDEWVQDIMNDIEHAEFDATTTTQQVPHAQQRVSAAWRHAFLS